MTSFSRSRSAIISGTGSAFPSRLVTNAELGTMLGHEVAAQIADQHEVLQRFWCGPDESTADLAEEAARRALATAGVDPHEVSLLVVATDTPEFVTPPTSSVVHGRLELTSAYALDLSAGGADFVAALDHAWKALRDDTRLRHVLVVGVSAVSKYLDVHDVRTVPIYGDGAGAVVLTAGDAGGVLATTCRTMGQHSHDVGVFAGGTRTPVSAAVLDAGLQNRLRVLRGYPDTLPVEWAQLVQDTLARAALSEGDIGHWLWAHPSRTAMSEAFSRCRTDGAPEGMSNSPRADVGYVGAASLPMALDHAVRNGHVRDGEFLLLTSAGAGVAMGAAAVQWVARAPA